RGSYGLRATPEKVGREKHYMPATLDGVPDSSSNTVIQLSLASSISGRVFEADGSPAKAAVIDISASGELVSDTTTNEDGQFVVDVPEGLLVDFVARPYGLVEQHMVIDTNSSHAS